MRTAYLDLLGFGFTSQISHFFMIPAASRGRRYASPGLSDGARDGYHLNNIKPINYARRSEGMDAVLLVVMLSLALLLFIVALLLIFRTRDATAVHPPRVSGPAIRTIRSMPIIIDQIHIQIMGTPLRRRGSQGGPIRGTCHCRNVPGAGLRWVLESSSASSADTR